MNHELLQYLQSSADDWLGHYQVQSAGDQTIIAKYYSNSLIAQKIQEKLTQIEARAMGNTNIAVFIAESNPLEFITAFFAGIMAEVNLFLCNPAWQEGEWQQVLNLAKLDLIYGDRNTQDLIIKLAARDSPTAVNLPSQSLIMIPTGGTSGKIKFAMHSWNTLKASVIGFQDYFTCKAINSACTLPLYHVSGLMQLMRSLLTGGKLTIFDYKLIQTRQIPLNPADYFISLVPTQLQKLVDSVPKYLSKFKIILLGGAPARRSLLDKARQYQIRIALTYGMTETASGIVILKPDDFLAGNNSNGQVLSQAKIEIIYPKLKPLINSENRDNNNQTAKYKNYQSGLIKIKSQSLCLGYYPEFFSSEKALLTDDLGYYDSAGYIHILGRNSHKIITGGENVFPTEVETAIYATKLVKDICIIGVPDLQWGQAVTAFYVPLDSAPPLDIIKQKIRGQLAKYKHPKHWITLDSLPYNNQGKINHQKLQAIALQQLRNY